MSTSPLDLPISFFEYDRKRNAFANVPSQQTTLRRIVTTKYYKAPIEAIRAELDKAKQDEMKKYQPAITPVALLNHRKANTTNGEKIKQQWPMLMGDIDKKDNPEIDMVELKKHLSTLLYVLLCAYSVRGGLWFVVRLPDEQTPDSLAAHFRYLQKLFTKIFGIKLDSTKGGKATDLRFVSFDEEPYFNDNATIMEGTYTPPPPKSRPVQYSSNIKEDEGTLLKRLVRFVEKAGDGERHETLLKAARLAGGFIAAGRLSEETAVYALETIASEWPNHSKSQKTIRDGIKHGMSAPVYPEERTTQRGTKREAPIQTVYKNPDASEEITVHSRPTLDSYAHEKFERILYTVQERALSPQPVHLPALLEYTWHLFSRPPLWWNKIAAHKALLRCLDPETKEPTASHSSILKPNETPLERLTVEPVDSYPAEWDEPTSPDAVPQIKAMTFFEWQRQHSSFSKLGVASLQTPT